MALQYLSARAGANGRCGATHILNLHPAGQNPETLGDLLVADPSGGMLTERERREEGEKAKGICLQIETAKRGKKKKGTALCFLTG